MEVLVAETGPCSRALTVTVPSAAVQQHLDQMFASAQQQVQIKGFRPGKVPRAIVEKKFGAAILAEAKEQMLNRFFGEACRTKDINPVGRVAIDEFETLEVKPGAPLKFTAKIDVRPEFELKTTKGLEVEAFDSDASDADVDNALREIVHQKRTIRPTTEAAQDGDFLKADYSFRDAGGAEVATKKGIQLNTRLAIHGTKEDEFKAAVIGATAGKKLSIAIEYPANFEKEAVRGQKGTVELTVHEVMRVTPPPIDDELAKGLEFADLAALRADLKGRIAGEKLRLGKQRQEEQLLAGLIATHDIALPPSLVEEQQQAALGSLAHRMQESGAGEDEIRKKLDESKDEAKQDAERRVRLFFLIEAVARQQKLFVTENDIEAELRAIALANSNENVQFTSAQAREFLEQQNRLGELRLSILERKVRDFLRENAKIVDKKGA
ncbi:MAG: trigger factor [Planctomycetes bacterium]|nr:trigger factor [Planctomycetota bacterium]